MSAGHRLRQIRRRPIFADIAGLQARDDDLLMAMRRQCCEVVAAEVAAFSEQLVTGPDRMGKDGSLAFLQW
jgi:hypothetical protein